MEREEKQTAALQATLEKVQMGGERWAGGSSAKSAGSGSGGVRAKHGHSGDSGGGQAVLLQFATPKQPHTMGGLGGCVGRVLRLRLNLWG